MPGIFVDGNDDNTRCFRSAIKIVLREK